MGDAGTQDNIYCWVGEDVAYLDAGVVDQVHADGHPLVQHLGLQLRQGGHLPTHNASNMHGKM